MRSQKAVYSQDVGLTAILDAFEADTTKKHDSKIADAFGATASEDQATSLVFMTRSGKERPTVLAKPHRIKPFRILLSGGQRVHHEPQGVKRRRES